MGFGILFIGYLFLFNFSFFGYTDVLAGVLMLYALEKLRRWNKGFQYAFLAAVPFTLVGLWEFILKLLSSFSVFVAAPITLATDVARFLLLCPLHLLLLLGLKQITAEVGLTKMENRALTLMPISALIFVSQALFEIDPLFSRVQAETLLSIRFILLLGALLYTLTMAIFIYKTYARICLPADADMKQRPSRFKFINDYRARKAEKEKREIEERIAEMKRRNATKRKKKKK